MQSLLMPLRPLVVGSSALSWMRDAGIWPKHWHACFIFIMCCYSTKTQLVQLGRCSIHILFCFCFSHDLFSNGRFARLSNIEQNETLDQLLQEKREVKGNLTSFLFLWTLVPSPHKTVAHCGCRGKFFVNALVVIVHCCGSFCRSWGGEDATIPHSSHWPTPQDCFWHGESI